MIAYAWTAISLCLLHSAIFSGLNIGLFGLSHLRLQVEAEKGNPGASRILVLRRDANFLLTTLLWGNVCANVLLALLTDSLMSGLGAFVFSTVGITMLGEILPQAYLSRNALRAAPLLVPLVRFYQMILFPVAKPTARLLDAWLGKEPVDYYREKELAILLRQHALASSTDVALLEGRGAANFLALDDIWIDHEGEIVDPESILSLPTGQEGLPQFPVIRQKSSDPFLQKVHRSGRKWVIITDAEEEPRLVLDAHSFLRHTLCDQDPPSPYFYCHRPILVRSANTKLGDVIGKLKVHPEHSEDDVVDDDLILYWGKERRILTGADILGRLMRGIALRTNDNYTLNQEPPS